MTVPFLQDSTFTGLISTLNHGTSQQWYEAFNTVSLFIQTSSINIQNTTFNDLSALKSSNGLIPGTFYQINDFELKWRNQGYFDPEQFKSSGVIEPLIVFAITLSSISPIAYSTLHPNDVVFYDIDTKRSTGWGDFPGFGVEVPGIKGWITRRIDQVRNIDIGWDWRYITNNCCKFNFSDVPVYSSTTTYNKNNIIRTNTGKLYISVSNNNLNRSTLNNPDWWLPVTDSESEVDTYYPTNEISRGGFFGDNILKQYLPGTVTPILSTRTQLPTFPNPNSTTLKNIKIESGYNNVFTGSTQVINTVIGNDFSFNLLYTYLGFGIAFENNTIGSSFKDNIIGIGFYSNQISNGFRNNITIGRQPVGSPLSINQSVIDKECIGNFFANNFIFNKVQDGFERNIVGRNFSSNTIGAAFYENNIGRNFSNNNVKTGASNNIIDNFCSSNTVGAFFSDNIVSNGFTNNIIGDNCIDNNFSINTFFNRIGTNFSYNSILTDFTLNILENEVQYNTIQSGCARNIFGSFFVNNNVGTEFVGNIIGNDVNDNNIGNNVQFNRFSNSFQNNILGNNFTNTTTENNITNIDFTSATHVYNNYSKTIFLNANNSIRLSYFNNDDQLVVTDPES